MPGCWLLDSPPILGGVPVGRGGNKTKCIYSALHLSRLDFSKLLFNLIRQKVETIKKAGTENLRLLFKKRVTTT